MASITVHAIYDGRAFVPTEPVDLPVGSSITASVDAPPAPSAMPEGLSRPQTPEEWATFVARTAGSWADFDFVEPEELPYDKEESLF